jgi:hypothetical protein
MILTVIKLKFLLSATLTASCSGILASGFRPLAVRSGITSSFCSYHLESEENDTIISIEFKLSTNKNLGDFSSINDGCCCATVLSFFFSSFCCGNTCFNKLLLF